MGCLTLHQRRSGQSMIARRSVTLLQRLLNQKINNRAIFSMKRNHSAVLPDSTHRLKNSGVVDHNRTRIGHKHFETADTFVANRHLHVRKDVSVYMRYDDMKAVIYAGFATGRRLRAANCLQRAYTCILECEIDNCCCPAKCRRPGPGFEVVACCAITKSIFHMRMTINATRKDD